MKHNKKRNTAFIYETLSRELTKAIIKGDVEKRSIIISIIKEHFCRDAALTSELCLYRVLLETENIQEKIAERMLQETKHAYSQLSGDTIFDAQSKVITAINKKVGQHVWSNFIPNFKSIASVNAIFNNKTDVKKRVLFEQAIVDNMSTKKLFEDNILKPIDNITYHAFINRFNDKYGGLLQEQKDLLNRYITSFADDGFELRLYLNEELSRLKGLLGEAAAAELEPLISEKVSEVAEYLESFRRREFTDTDLHKILKTQELVQELAL